MVNAIPGSVIGKQFWVPGPLWSLKHHTGLDLIAPVGTPIHAMIGGTVITANSYVEIKKKGASEGSRTPNPFRATVFKTVPYTYSGTLASEQF